MGQEVTLEVADLRKTYGDFVAVDSIGFQTRKGEVFGLLGPNGAGKTTTIRMICGLLKKTSGQIYIKGMSFDKEYSKVKSLIGLCPQELVVWELLTCMEQLEFMGISYGFSKKKAREQGEILLRKLGLEDKKKSWRRLFQVACNVG